MESSFAKFYREVENNNPKVYHFFKRDNLFSSHGNQASRLAVEFYKTDRVLKKEAFDLRTLNLTRTLFAKVSKTLLAGNSSLCIWKKEGTTWETFRRASPGNVKELELELGTSLSYDIASVAVIAAVFLEEHNGIPYIGVSVVSTAVGLIDLVEFIDSSDFSNLESVLVQYGIREVIIRADNDDEEKGMDMSTTAALDGRKKKRAAKNPSSRWDDSILGLYQKLGVAVTRRPTSYFICLNEPAEAIQSLERVCIGTQSRPDIDSSLAEEVTETKQALQEASNMHHALRASIALLRHLDLTVGNSDYGSYRLRLGSLDTILHYDSNVSRALSVFPETNDGQSYADIMNEVMTSSAAAARVDDAQQSLGFLDGDHDDDGAITAKTNKNIADLTGRAPDSLFVMLNATKTPMGARTLRRWLQQPSRDTTVIAARQQVITALILEPSVRSTLRDDPETLCRCPDLEKIARRLGNKPVTATLFDLVAVYRSLLKLQAIGSLLSQLDSQLNDMNTSANLPSATSSTSSLTYGQVDSEAHSGKEAAVDVEVEEGRRSSSTGADDSSSSPSSLVNKINQRFADCAKLMALIEELLDIESLVAGSKKDRLWGDKWIQVRPNFTNKLRELHRDLSQCRAAILNERNRAAAVAGVEVKAMNLERSPVHGIHLRVTKKDSSTALKKLQASDKNKITTLSTQKAGTLFLTAQLSKLVKTYEALAEQYDATQRDIVSQALDVAGTYESILLSAAALMAEVDCLASLAHVAAAYDWVCPQLIESGDNDGSSVDRKELVIEGLRHPIVEAQLGANYVKSDVRLEDGCSVAIITGPNCGGKSTFIRAVGLCVLLAHMGSFVPATTARIPIMDHIITRVGATDSTFRGVSTFMAEMLDVNSALRKATSRSLVIIDELGRGTSTQDGFGIAWAVLDHLATRTNCFTLFATHFHELTEMENVIPSVRNFHVSAHVAAAPAESSGRTSGPNYSEITMLYQVAPGACERSYGVAVARLAKFPQEIVDEADALAMSMESQGSKAKGLIAQDVNASADAPLTGTKRKRQNTTEILVNSTTPEFVDLVDKISSLADRMDCGCGKGTLAEELLRITATSYF